MVEHSTASVSFDATCNLCGRPAEYDGKTTMGPWAYMCAECFHEYGVGLGLGRGQKLVKASSSEIHHTQGGGTARWDALNGRWVFVTVPEDMFFEVGDFVPDDWGVQ